MTEKQIKEGLLKLDRQHPFYVALLALLDGDIGEEMAEATRLGLTDGARQFAAGRLAHAADIRRAVEGVILDAETERVAQLRKDELRRQREATLSGEG